MAERAPAARPQTLTRDEWVARYSVIEVSGITVTKPLPEKYVLDSGLTLLRVGSFWREDVEQHVYGIGQAVSAMAELRSRGKEMTLVTPVFVFRRSGDGAEPVMSDAVLRKAAANFVRLFEDLHRRPTRG